MIHVQVVGEVEFLPRSLQIPIDVIRFSNHVSITYMEQMFMTHIIVIVCIGVIRVIRFLEQSKLTIIWCSDSVLARINLEKLFSAAAGIPAAA